MTNLIPSTTPLLSSIVTSIWFVLPFHLGSEILSANMSKKSSILLSILSLGPSIILLSLIVSGGTSFNFTSFTLWPKSVISLKWLTSSRNLATRFCTQTNENSRTQLPTSLNGNWGKPSSSPVETFTAGTTFTSTLIPLRLKSMIDRLPLDNGSTALPWLVPARQQPRRASHNHGRANITQHSANDGFFSAVAIRRKRQCEMKDVGELRWQEAVALLYAR